MEKEEVKVNEIPVEEKTQPQAEAPVKDENKVFKILSYIWLLWLVGLFVKEKNDKSVRFHVGQGIILTIAEVILAVAVPIVNAIVLMIGGWGLGSLIAYILNLAVWVFNILFMVLGIVNAAKGRDEELPFIGKFAFYK